MASNLILGYEPYIFESVQLQCFLMPSQRQEGCTGFTVEILEEVPKGEDILAHEDLWVRYIDIELSRLSRDSNKSTLNV